MPDLEVETEAANSSSIEEKKNTDNSQSDLETDSFKDASYEIIHESPVEQPLVLETPPDRPILSQKVGDAEDVSSSSTSSTTGLDHEKNGTTIINGVESIKQPESPTPSPQFIPSESVDHSKHDSAPLSPEILYDSALQQSSQVPDIGPTSTIPAISSQKSLPSLPKSPRNLPKLPNNSTSSSSAQSSTSTSTQLGQPYPAVSTRKLTSAFSWLSRATPKDSSPPTPMPSANIAPRRSTASSVATTASTSEVAVGKLEETNETEGLNGSRRPSKNSLKDRFKILRMREEAGINSLPEEDEDESTIAGQTGVLARQTSPKNTKEKDVISPLSPLSLRSKLSLSNAVGETGVAAHTSPVDWDLWQSVVDEGPAAFAKTSSEELNHAIASGIPSAIRGVVWQILAQSKNEGLETVYRDLVTRGTDKDKNKDGMSSSNGFVGNSQTTSTTNGKDEAVTSSASSVHSDNSTTTNSTVSGLRSSSPPKDSEASAKSLAASLVEKKKKAKQDAVSLQKLEKTIKRDLGARTSFSKFATSAGLQDGLFGVCKAYALFDEGVGYAQGMNFLAMPLLFNMPEDEAFCLLVKLMNQYHLRDLFIQDMPGLHLRLYQFERLLEDLEPALYCHLQRRQITPHLYATQWFLTLFAYRFPLQLVLRIYDLILSEGLGAIIKFGVVLMQKNSETLLGISDMVTLTNYLKDRLFDVYIDEAPSSESILESGFFGSSGSSIDKEIYRADQLVQDACAIKITPELLNTYTLEWEEKTRIEKERETELQNYKISNQKLLLKVRGLEERVQDHDTEHAALATELVRTKVVNEELKDENESLKVQVKELRDVIEKLPDEVEQKLKTEMDRLLKRNQEVHDENNRLEDDMSNMEKTLIETKMQYAEIHAAHEALTRKWNDLRKALDY